MSLVSRTMSSMISWDSVSGSGGGYCCHIIGGSPGMGIQTQTQKQKALKESAAYKAPGQPSICFSTCDEDIYANTKQRHGIASEPLLSP